MSDQETAKRTGFAITEGLLIAVVSAGAYLLAFYYEKGFTSYFKIPMHFVSVSLVTIFILVAVAISFLLLIVPIVDFIFGYLPRLHPVLYPGVGVLLFVSLFSVIHLYLFGLSNWPVFIFHLVMLVLVAAIFLLLPMIIHRKKGKVIERLEEQQKIDQSVLSIYDVIASRFGRESLLVIALSILSINFAENAGRAQAMKQTEFLVLNTEPEMVVLQIYEENMICAPFNRNTKEVETRFRFVKIAEDPKLILNLEKVGPLHPYEPKPAQSPTPFATPESSPTETPSISPVTSPNPEPKATPTSNPQ
jgi:hypothetical protein